MVAQGEAWLRRYAALAFHAEDVVAGTRGQLLIFNGPPEWEPAADGPPSPAEVAEEAAELGASIPFTGERAAYLVAHLDAFAAAAAGTEATTTASRCLGAEVDRCDEAALGQAHDDLDRALPAGRGGLAERLHAWQRAHTCPDPDLLPGLVGAATVECRRRSRAIVDLPPITGPDVVVAPGPHRGHYLDGASTIHISDAPFNLADLLHVVAHESFPGHIAESALIDRHLVRGQGRLEHGVRFLLSPSFVVSEGIGLHAPALAFPGDEGQAWLHDHVLAPLGLDAPLGDLAAIHRARNELWGAWGDAALLALDGRPDQDVRDHLQRWALCSDAEAGWAVAFFRDTPGMAVYTLAYALGWRLVGRWLGIDDRRARARRLLTEPLLPSDLAVT